MAIILAATDKMTRTVNAAFGNAENRLKNVQRRSDEIARNAGRWGRQTAAVGLAVAAPLALAVKTGMAFEQQMANVGAVAGASEAQLAEMAATARRLGSTTQFSATQAAEAMEFLAMAGFGVEKSQKALPDVLNLSAAGAIDLGRAADISSNILSGFNLQAADLARTNDILVNTFTTSNTNLSMLGDTMKYVAPIAATLGIEVAEVAAMAGKLGDAGIQGEMAGTAMRQMFLRLASPVRMAKNALAEIGVTTKDASGNLKDMPSLLAEIGQKVSKLPTAAKASVLKRIFGTEASAAAAILTQKAANGELLTYIDAVQKAGTASEVAGKKMNTQRGAMLLAKSAGEELALTVSDILAPAVTAIFGKIAKAAQVAAEWAKRNPGLTKTIVVMTAGIAVLLTTLGGLALVVSGVSSAVAVLSGAMAFLAANPVVLVIAGVAALAAGIAYLWNNSEKFRGTLVGIWEWLKGLADLVKNYVVGQFSALGKILVGIATFNPAKIASGISEAWSNMKKGWQGMGSLNQNFTAGYAQGAGAISSPGAVNTPNRKIAPVNQQSSLSVNFAPSVNVQGGTAMDKRQFMDSLKQYEPELMRLIKEGNRKEQRLAY